MPILRYLDEAGQVRMREVGDEPIVIGRAATCQLILDSDMISREHARIEKAADGRWALRDLGSRNKTFVDGQAVAETFIRGGDVIRFGDRVVEFLDDAGPREKIELDFLTPDKTEPADCEWIKIKAPLSLTGMQVEELARVPGLQRLTARPEDLADTALSQIMLDLGAERGLIAVRGQGKRELIPIAQRGLKKIPGTPHMPVSQSFVFASILQSVAGRYPMSAGSIDPKSGYAAVGLVAPLTQRGEIVGLIYVDRPTTKKPFPSSAVPQMAAAGAMIGALMADATRRLAESHAREGAAWMTNLRRLLDSLQLPTADNEAFVVRTKRISGRGRCGDLFDVIHLDEQRSAIVMVDGGGRGLTGIVQAGGIRTGIRTALAAAPDMLNDPAAVFHALGEIAADSPSRQTIPCTLVGIDLAAGKISYINAGGIPPVLMVAPGRLMTLDQPALVLGVDKSYIYDTTYVDLPDRFRVVCFSDGLPEAANIGGEPLTTQRIHDALLDQDAFATPEAVIARIHKAMTAHVPSGEPEDDASIVVVGRG
jgi:pSer/pThr/pTyr-binding forkhead associated (FHA) protein